MSYLEDRVSSHDSNHCGRPRFPEHAYCWFADKEKPSSSDDEDRWAFYYDLKMSVDSNPECWLVYNLLDDMQGEDFISFLIRALEKVQSRMEASWNLQFGKALTCRESIKGKSQLINALHQHGQSLDEEDTSCTATNIWLPVEICSDITCELFHQITLSDHAEKLASNMNEMATEIESPLTSETVTPSVDLFSFLQMSVKEYLSHRKKQVTLIRLKFETASNGVLTDFYDNVQESTNASNREAEGLISVHQLYQILKTIWPCTTLGHTTVIYRVAYNALYPLSQWREPAPDGINFQSFLIAAERLSLFSKGIL